MSLFFEHVAEAREILPLVSPTFGLVMISFIALSYTFEGSIVTVTRSTRPYHHIIIGAQSHVRNITEVYVMGR